MPYLSNKSASRFLLLSVVVLLLAGCSSTKRVERKAHREVYEMLGMEESHKDNFALYKEAASWLNTHYAGGGFTHRGTDCSGLVYMIYKNVYGKTLERNSASMLQKNCQKISLSHLREGDLVFFNTTGSSKLVINHVGIYLRDNKFIHASISKGVIVSSLDEPYYKKTWICGGNVKYYR